MSHINWDCHGSAHGTANCGRRDCATCKRWLTAEPWPYSEGPKRLKEFLGTRRELPGAFVSPHGDPPPGETS